MMDDGIFQEREDINTENKEIIGIRTPYSVKTVKDAHRVINDDILNKIEAQEERIKINKEQSFDIHINSKNPEKPFHLIKLKKMIGKRTKKIKYRIQEVKSLKKVYDYEEMSDFVSSSGSEIVYGEKKSKVEIKDLMAFIQKQLNNKIFGEEDQKQNYLKLIRPQSFLKNYNLAPPKCDIFMSKSRVKQVNPAIASINISFEDPIPTKPLQQVPESIKKLQIYEVISSYLTHRKCWLKNVLIVTLKQNGFQGKYTMNELKNALRYLCYTYRNGPWKYTFCQFGFDPKSSSQSVFYQNISLKLKQKEAQDYEEGIEEDIYDPTFKDISNRCLRGYQLCDLAQGHHEIQQILNGKKVCEETECNKELGWLNAAQHSQIIKIMKKKLQNDSGIVVI